MDWKYCRIGDKMINEDYEIDDILGNLNKKKERKKNTSKKKGNRGENELADILCERFPGKKFFRVVGSGNRGSQVDLPEEMKNAFTGDLVCPKFFSYTMEVKYGYSDIDLWSLFTGQQKKIEEWMKQALRESSCLNKKPLICWRKPRQPWLAILQNAPEATPKLEYNGWSFVALTSLLEQPDDFWFTHKVEIDIS